LKLLTLGKLNIIPEGV